ncbi:MAG: putative patatin-like phospholipase [uncultured marine phage]|uniref:Putative patatin-like phospholipase n=1 Tax=uncultured marine phage TaxID=707152 RepID=A0A8D9FRM5_9VIRU|nr:MAG: putative patatin-like phospholipase [uncultured marine phage]
MSEINVLSIDGGGIRGVLPAEILIYVEEKIQELTNSDIRLAEHFDLIVGTSTGGILTCIYCLSDENGKPKYTAVDASNLYLKNGGDIFKKEFSHRVKTLWGLAGPRYSHKNVEKLFDKYMGEDKLDTSVTNMMLTSVNTKGSGLYLFKSFKAKIDPSRNHTFKDAARATSSAPTYFAPHKLNDMSLIDGGMAINNPSMSAYVEAMKLFPKAKKINLLSIGTARTVDSFTHKKTKKWGILNWIVPLFDIILIASARGVEYQADLLYKSHIKGEYLRIDPVLGDADDEMDNASPENLKLLKEAGIKSLSLNKDNIDMFLKKTIKP